VVTTAAPRLFEVPSAPPAPPRPAVDHRRRRRWRRCDLCATYRVVSHHSICPVCLELVTAYPILWLESF